MPIQITDHQHQIMRLLGGFEGWGPIIRDRAQEDIAALKGLGLVEDGEGPGSFMWRLSARGAGNRCEGSPAYPDCRAENGKPHPVTGSRVVLTVAHLNHRPEDCDPENLRAWCQRCHNTYDAPMRAAARRERMVRRGHLP